ncbi:MAG: L,D-transpeptidase [Polyangiaceae bacterium]|nr:L,D-transpeptidase [Polyangiaceae bacterium]
MVVRFAATLCVGLICAACSADQDPPGRAVDHRSALTAPDPKAFAHDAGDVPDAAPTGLVNDDGDELLDPGGPKLVALAMETYIHRSPSHQSPRLGYLRAGTIVARKSNPAGNEGCSGGFYRIAPRGYVCAGKTASLDAGEPLGEAAMPGPKRGEAYPYHYVISRSPAPHLYVRLPTVEDQRRVEGRPATGPVLNPWARAQLSWLGPADPLTPFLQSGRDLPKPIGAEERLRFPVHRGRAKAKSAFGLMATFDWTDRRFGFTTELDLIPIDRTQVVRPSRMHGVRIETPGVPAFVMHGGGRVFERLKPGKFKPIANAEFRSGWVLTGNGDGVTVEEASRGYVPAGYLETTSGVWLAAEGLRVGALTQDSWGYAKKGKKWIDVSIERQLLIAYEGTRPVFATLVSTGRGGLGDPKVTSATVQGVFFIQSKHVSTTMDGSGGAASRDLHDVPYVQYFQGNYALHGVYWHDGFGKTMSSGCVNLAPADALWLFEWTDPTVPSSWHGAYSPQGGTLVYIHR